MTDGAFDAFELDDIDRELGLLSGEGAADADTAAGGGDQGEKKQDELDHDDLKKRDEVIQ